MDSLFLFCMIIFALYLYCCEVIKVKDLNQLLESNKGFITFNQVKEAGVPYSIVRNKLETGELEKDVSGIYRKPDVYIDDLFVLQYKFPKGIYSLETALWLHGLSLTVPFNPVMSFPYGTNTKILKKAGIKPVVLRKNYDIGVVETRTPAGQLVRVYDVERALTESLRGIYSIDTQIVGPSFRAYIEMGKIDYSKLLYYAKLFRVTKKAQAYLEVL